MEEINEMLKAVKYIDFIRDGRERLISFIFDFNTVSIQTENSVIEGIADMRASFQDFIYIDRIGSEILLRLKNHENFNVIFVRAPMYPGSPTYSEMQWRQIEVELVTSQLVNDLPFMLRSNKLEERALFSGCIFNSTVK
jgi:hypothetical protein